MKTEEEVQHLVVEWATQCINFIQTGRKGEVGKKISASDRKEIEIRVGEKCPTCHIVMSPTIKKGRKPRKGEIPVPSSITVEHIVPRTLGGNNKRDNLIAMCHQCNMYRNATMTVSIPHFSSIRGKSLSKEEITQVSRFIEWSIRTIHSPSNKVDKVCSEIFENFIANIEKPKISVVAKKPVILVTENNQIATDDSLENNSISELIELLREISDTQKTILEQLQKSLSRRLIDWLVTPFRLISRNIRLRRKNSKSISTSKVKKIDTHPPEEMFEVKNNLEEPVRTILIEKGDKYPMDDSTNLDGINRFRLECLRVIDESMSPAKFSMKLSASISEHGFEEMSGKEFARHCGIPNGWSLLKALQTYLSDSICVDGKGTAAIITPLALQDNEIPIEDHDNEQVLNQVSTKASEFEYTFDSEDTEPTPQTTTEPVAVQQWTDEAGHTWRLMDNKIIMWWNGTDWQQV